MVAAGGKPQRLYCLLALTALILRRGSRLRASALKRGIAQRMRSFDEPFARALRFYIPPSAASSESPTALLQGGRPPRLAASEPGLDVVSAK